MDVALAGHRWGSLRRLDGSARPRLAGAGAPAEASGVALTVRSPAWQRDGVPVHVLADRGGACLSDAFAGGWTRLAMDHQTLGRPQGHSAMHLRETPGNLPRRLEDSPLAWPRTPCEGDEAPHRFRARSTTTAPQGRRQERCASPLPLHVLGASKGRLSPPQARARQGAQALVGRPTHREGGVPLHRSHCDVDQGRAQTPGVLGVAGEDLRAGYDHVLVAEEACHDDLRTGQGTRLRLGQGSPSPFAARQAQGALRERTPQDALSGSRPPAGRRPAASPVRAGP
jgi:hypothetical protein